MPNSLKHRLIKLGGEGLWIAFGQTAVVAASLVSVRVLTGYLTPQQYGQLALAITVSALANQTLMGGLANAIGRYYSIAAEQGDLDVYISDGLKLIAAAAGLVFAAGLLSCGLLAAANYSEWVFPALLIVALAIVSGCSVCLNAFHNAARHRAVVSLQCSLDAWLKIAFAVLAISIMGPSSPAVLSGFVVSSAVVLALQFVFLTRSLSAPASVFIRRSDGSRWIKPMLVFAWPFSTWGGFTWAQQSADRWSLAAFANMAAVGQYNVAYQLGYAPIAILTNLCSTLFGPLFFSRVGPGGDELRRADVRLRIWGLTLAAATLTFVAFSLALALHEIIFRVLVSERFLSGSVFLPWLVLGGGLFATGQMLTIQHLAELKPHALIGIKISTAVLGCVASILGALYGGAWGVVGAVTLFGATYLAAVLWSVLRRL